MKFSKFFFASLFAVCVAVTMSACRSTDGTSEFYVEDTPQRLSAADFARNNGNNGNGSFDLSGNSGSGYDLNGDNSGPGEYQDDPLSGEDYVDGFGPRVAGANLDPVYFPFDQNTVSYSEMSKVEAAAAYLKKHSNQGIVVEGNCDERGTLEYNRALGERRALSVKSALLQRGVDESRIKTLSWGEEKPAVSGSNEQAWGMNRRAELVPVYLKK